MAHISAVINGLTPRQIRRDISLAEGYQYEAQWRFANGLSIVPASLAKPKKKDRLR